ncbi:hypothetical protein [uncultured Bacteroides sp.]|uniref:hypothetical protein n=1 Tax=uncultured Bacteroides sp. TaxID=162156 RepID=UPI002608DF91|nr:hypothetical protein [uncultured Bacteroides sp.]
MELDELKKSWNALEEHLQKGAVTDEKQIKRLIAAYKTNTRKSMGRLANLQRISLLTGVVVLIALVLAGLLLPTFIESDRLQKKMSVLLIFIGASILVGFWWDWRICRRIHQIRIDEMPIVEVSRRMTAIRQCFKYEIIAICIWAVAFYVLDYWAMDYYLASAARQATIIALFLGIGAVFIYLLYKRFIYRHLENIKKNIEELKDICTE